MTVRDLLPAKPFALDCAGTGEACRAQLDRALTPSDKFEFVRLRVRGVTAPDAVRLWYSLRPRPARLAPQLFAEWRTADGRVRLVGTFRQDPRIARLTLGTGVVLAAVLMVLAARGGLPWTFALAGGAALAGYPWIAWWMASHHLEKIGTFLRETVGPPGG